MRPFGRDGNGTMNGPYSQVDDAQIARLAAADQRDRDQKRPGDTPIGAVANDQFASQRFRGRWKIGVGHKLGAGRRLHAMYHLAGFADTSKPAGDWGILRILQENPTL